MGIKDVPYKSIEGEKMENKVVIPNKRWFTLIECAELKGVNYKTLCNRKELQPNSGTEDCRLGGRKMFSRATLISWLDQTDEDILNREAMK